MDYEHNLDPVLALMFLVFIAAYSLGIGWAAEDFGKALRYAPAVEGTLESVQYGHLTVMTFADGRTFALMCRPDIPLSSGQSYRVERNKMGGERIIVLSDTGKGAFMRSEGR